MKKRKERNNKRHSLSCFFPPCFFLPCSFGLGGSALRGAFRIAPPDGGLWGAAGDAEVAGVGRVESGEVAGEETISKEKHR